MDIYSDGSGTTGGPAGIAFVAYGADGEFFREGSGPLRDATNNQAEILAATLALRVLQPCVSVVVSSDSTYVVNGMTVRLDGWIARGWRLTGSSKPVKNQLHWQMLIEAVAQHGHVDFRWIPRGSHPGNVRADKLAGDARQQALAETRGPLL